VNLCGPLVNTGTRQNSATLRHSEMGSVRSKHATTFERNSHYFTAHLGDSSEMAKILSLRLSIRTDAPGRTGEPS
jgi:hypothetical protein